MSPAGREIIAPAVPRTRSGSVGALAPGEAVSASKAAVPPIKGAGCGSVGAGPGASEAAIAGAGVGAGDGAGAGPGAIGAGVSMLSIGADGGRAGRSRFSDGKVGGFTGSGAAGTAGAGMAGAGAAAAAMIGARAA